MEYIPGKKVLLVVFTIMLCTWPVKKSMAQPGGNPFPEMRGYSIIRDYPVYHADDLWDYIDGAADNYLNYRFGELQIAEYVKGKDKVFFKVEVYHHLSPLYAFGIYSAERSPGYHYISLGTQGFRESNQIYFLKGPYYVKVLAMQEGSRAENDLPSLAEAVAARLPGPEMFPPELRIFPPEEKISNSERFIASDFLGHSFFDSVFTATYHHGGKEFTLFLTRRADPESAQTILVLLYQSATGKVPALLEEGDRMIKDGYNGNIYLIWKDNVLFGFQDIEDHAFIRKLASEILDKL